MSNKKAKQFFLIAFSSIFATSFFILSELPYTNAQSDDDEDITKKYFAISIKSDKVRYIPGQFLEVSGNVLYNVPDTNGTRVPKIVTILVNYQDGDKNTEPHKISTVTDTLGKFHDEGYALEFTGIYTITATAAVNGIEETSFTQVIVHNPTESPAVLAIITGIVALLLLLVIIGIGVKLNTRIRELFLFVFITTMMFAAISFFIVNDVEIGTYGAFGLVNKEPIPDDIQETLPLWNKVTGWVINVGGDKSTGYISGVQIPIFVLMFGIAGGYVRYLSNLSRSTEKIGKFHRERMNILLDSKTLRETSWNWKWWISSKPDETKSEDWQNKEWKKIRDYARINSKIREEIFQRSIDDLSLLILAPLLAIASFFLLAQAGINDVKDYPTIAAVSFGVGLVTNRVISRLKGVAGGALEKKPPKTPQKTPPKTTLETSTD